jgi:hypothetical protein
MGNNIGSTVSQFGNQGSGYNQLFAGTKMPFSQYGIQPLNTQASNMPMVGGYVNTPGYQSVLNKNAGNQAQSATQPYSGSLNNIRGIYGGNQRQGGQSQITQNPWMLLAQRLMANNTYGSNPGMMPYWMSFINRR